MKKVFARCLVLILACTWLLTPVQADVPAGSSVRRTLITEDFEAYAVNDPLLTGLGVEFAGGNWVSNAYLMGEGAADQVHFGISEGESGNLGWTDFNNTLGTKALAVETAATWNRYEYFPTVSPVGITMRSGNKYTITTDLYISHYATGAAIRLFAHNPNQDGIPMNFYMLYFPGANAGDNKGCRLIKFENGSATELYTDTNTNPIQQLQWYTLNLTYDNGTFQWTCVPRENYNGDEINPGARSFEGTCTDPAPYRDITAPFEYAAGGQGQMYAYFKNLEIVEEGIPDPTEELISEDFEAYEPDVPLLTGLSVEFAGGNWASNAYRMGEGAVDEAHFGISEGETWSQGGVPGEKNEIGTRALAIETSASWNMYPYFPTVSSPNITMQTENTYNITTDFYVGHYLTGAAIRLFAHNPDSNGMPMNFYMLYFPGDNAGDQKGCQFIKYENGTSTILYQDEDRNARQQLQWYTLNLTYDNGTFQWTCAPKAGGQGRSFSGSVTDPNPFTGVSAPFEYAGGGQTNMYAYFDNLTITTENPYAAGAPDNAFYVDVLRNRAVIAADGDNPAAVNDGDAGTVFTGSSLTVDLGLPAQLRGLEVTSLDAPADVTVKISADSRDYAQWLTLAEGRQYSATAQEGIRYIRLESIAPFSLGDVKVLSDAAQIQMRMGQKLYLHPRLGGADVTDAAYSFAQEQVGFATVEGNILTPSSQASSLTLTAEKDGQRTQVEIVILAEAVLASTADMGLTIEAGCDYLTEEGEYLFAFYDGQDRLIGVAIGASSALNSNAENTTITVTSPVQAYDHVQMFCWDGGWSGLYPLTEAVSF